MVSDSYCGLWKDDDSNVQFDWTRSIQPSTPSRSTGPSSAACGAKYMFIEASSPRVPGDAARLKSVGVNLKSGATLSFQYHMLGGSVGTLTVSVMQSGVAQVIFTKGGNSVDNTWRTAEVLLDQFGFSSTTSAEITIEATVAGWQGDIAIDDVKLTNYEVATPPPPAPTPAPSPAYDPGCYVKTPSGLCQRCPLKEQIH